MPRNVAKQGEAVVLGVTMGDVNGVGPEILLAAYARNALSAPVVVYGDLAVLEKCSSALGYGVRLAAVTSCSEYSTGALHVIDHKRLRPDDIKPGTLSQKSGAASLAYVNSAVRDAIDKNISAIVTLPVSKEAVRKSVAGFRGHTDTIAEACGSRDYAMTLISDKLVVAHVSSHVSLREALDSLNAQRIVTVVELTGSVLGKLNRAGTIAVMGVNPHAGENGAFGTEESAHIIPAVQACVAKGIDAVGPLPPDTVFMRALRGEFAAVVCMYHDQGHIPMKTIGLDDTVNVTVGLPIVRTSVDHGTAFDIAWKGVASTGSFVNACMCAAKLAA